MKRTRWHFVAIMTAMLAQGVLSAADQEGDASSLFERLDKNGDGSITVDEVPEDQQRLLQRLLRQGDQNADGKLSMQEFEQANKPEDFPKSSLNQEGDSRADARQRFEMLDRNKDGKVTLEEVPEPLRDRVKPIFDRLGKKELSAEDFARFAGGRPDPEDLLKRFDVNSDGKISKDELPAEVRQRLAPIFERIGKDEVTLEQLKQFGDRVRDAVGRPDMGKAEEMFARFDSNRDGKVTVDEVPERARPMVESVLRRAGKEAGGGLTKEDFLKYLPQGRDGEWPSMPGRRPEGSRPANDGPALMMALDLDRNGRLSKSELAKAAEKFDELDRNGDGSLDLAELLGGAVVPTPTRDSESRIEGRRPEPPRRPNAEVEGSERGAPLFQRFDRDSDGKISKDEAPEFLKGRFDMLDKNGDGFVSIDEFRAGAAGLGDVFRNRGPRRPPAESEGDSPRGEPKQ